MKEQKRTVENQTKIPDKRRREHATKELLRGRMQRKMLVPVKSKLLRSSKSARRMFTN